MLCEVGDEDGAGLDRPGRHRQQPIVQRLCQSERDGHAAALLSSFRSSRT